MVESVPDDLYFELLQFFYHLSLAILVGGGLVLGVAAAPAIFRTVRSRGEAGAIFGTVLASWDVLAIACVIVVAITSVLKAGAFEVAAAPEGRLIARWVALAVLALAVVFSSGWANPVARSIRAGTRDWDDLPATTPARAEFDRMHRASTRAMQLAILAGLVAMFLS